jgi:phosphohistidine phosphatase
VKLLLIRHAAAVASGTPGVADDERPLTAAGEADFRRAAGGLAWIVDPPEVLLSSPLARARATAGIAARTFGRLEPTTELALAHGTTDTVLSAIAAHGPTAGTIGVVGHEPLLASVLARLLGVADSDRLAFEKGGAALVELPGGLSRGGRLVWFLGPRILGTLGGRRESAEEERLRAADGITPRRMLLRAVRDYAAATWTPRRHDR